VESPLISANSRAYLNTATKNDLKSSSARKLR